MLKHAKTLKRVFCKFWPTTYLEKNNTISLIFQYSYYYHPMVIVIYWLMHISGNSRWVSWINVLELRFRDWVGMRLIVFLKKDNTILDAVFFLSVGNDKCPQCLKEIRVYHSYSTIMFDIFTCSIHTIVQESIKSREMVFTYYTFWEIHCAKVPILLKRKM